MYQAYGVASPDMKNLMSPTPLNCVRKAFTLALNDSGEAFRHTHKSVLPDCFHSVMPAVDIKYA